MLTAVRPGQAHANPMARKLTIGAQYPHCEDRWEQYTVAMMAIAHAPINRIRLALMAAVNTINARGGPR